MRRPTKCGTCDKTTWAGCGQHVARVRASVPANNWFAGHPKAESDAAGGWFSRLLDR